MKTIITSAILLLGFCHPAIADESLRLLPLPKDPAQFLLVQPNQQGQLTLGPNESFFPRLGLKADGQGRRTTDGEIAELNGGKSFAEIRDWDHDDVVEWGVWFSQPGDVDVRLEAAGRSSFVIQLGEQRKAIQPGKPTSFTVANAGPHTIRLICTLADRDASVRSIVLSGDAAKQISVIRKRWRPEAAHSKFESSQSPDDVRLWVMEMDAVPGELGFYSPITTPFGYYGPTWNADGSIGTGINFSLWSFTRGQPEPSIEKLSHLIAIGNREAKFGGFDHEGTGVKIRDWEPFAGRQGQRQAIALRVEPGKIYDTYYSYFYAADEQRWRLFGAGKNSINTSRYSRFGSAASSKCLVHRTCNERVSTQEGCVIAVGS